MAGSLKFFVYTDSFGQDWALWRDESNTEAVNAGTQDYAPGTPASVRYVLPRNVKPRYLRYVSTDGLVTRKVVALTEAILSGAPASVPTFVDSVSGKTMEFKEAVGERIVVPYAGDTGLTDGDAT